MGNQFINILYSTKKKMVFLEKHGEKKIHQVLTNVIGLSNSNSNIICKKFGFQKTCIIGNIDSSDLEQLKNYLTNNFLLDKLLIEKNVKSKIDLGIYTGKRHNLGYPVRGQRTLSNGKTQRNLHKFRFYYSSELFNHGFFKNQRKSFKNKKISKLKAKKKKKELLKKVKRNPVNLATKRYIDNQNRKKKIAEANYQKKLNKIREERKRQINIKLKKDFKKAKTTHPYFLNIKKGK